jgi:hypothetical protein
MRPDEETMKDILDQLRVNLKMRADKVVDQLLSEAANTLQEVPIVGSIIATKINDAALTIKTAVDTEIDVAINAAEQLDAGK